MRMQATPAEREAILRHLAERLEQRDEVLFAYVFGSFALGGWFGDIDLGVYVRPELLPERGALSLAFDLADYLERGLDVPVEVHIINDAPLHFQVEVIRGQALLSRDPIARAGFVERVLLAWWDTEGLRRAMVG